MLVNVTLICNPYVLAYQHLKETEESNFLVSPLCHLGALDQYLIKNRLQSLSEIIATQLLLQIILGLYSVHKIGYLHSNLCPSHILLTTDTQTNSLVPKLIGLGHLKDLNDRKALHLPVQDARYAPPEARRAKSRYSLSSEVYVVGLLYYYMLTGQVPFGIKDE
jgi:serine/threonine protein kinase